MPRSPTTRQCECRGLRDDPGRRCGGRALQTDSTRACGRSRSQVQTATRLTARDNPNRHTPVHPHLAYTLCQIPLVAHRAGPKRVEVTSAGGVSQVVYGLHLDAATSAAVFERTGQAQRLDVFFDLKSTER
jgi:hypothetical protein